MNFSQVVKLHEQGRDKEKCNATVKRCSLMAEIRCAAVSCDLSYEYHSALRVYKVSLKLIKMGTRQKLGVQFAFGFLGIFRFHYVA